MAYLQINPFAHVAYVHYANGFIHIYTIIFNFYSTARGGVILFPTLIHNGRLVLCAGVVQYLFHNF